VTTNAAIVRVDSDSFLRAQKLSAKYTALPRSDSDAVTEWIREKEAVQTTQVHRAGYATPLY
jgi:hypothetical protein